MYLFFDTETNGLPKNWKAPMTDLENWPRVIQLAWVMCDENRNIVSMKQALIQPDGWAIPKEKFWLDNGYSTERNKTEGAMLEHALDAFILDLNEAEHLIAHNLSFDYNVLGAEMLRYNKKGKKLTQHCTKLLGTNYCMLPGKYGDFKWPTLTELHTKLFDEGFTGAHDAMADVKACMRCYFGLKDAGV